MITFKRIKNSISLAEIFSEQPLEEHFSIPVLEDVTDYVQRVTDETYRRAQRPSQRGTIGLVIDQSIGRIFDYYARSVITDAVLQLNQTESGARLISAIETRDLPIIYSKTLKNETASAHLIIFPLGITTSAGEEILLNEGYFIELDTKSRDDIAMRLNQELRHLAQWENMSSRPSGKAISIHYKMNKGWGDMAFISLVMEADAYTRDLITAFEFNLSGNPNPLSEYTYGKRKPLAEFACGMLSAGVDLHSPELKRALFDKWMTDPESFRPGYEQSLISKSVRLAQKYWTPGITLTSKDLECIVAEKDGFSYLEGTNLLAPQYTQRLAALSADNVATLIGIKKPEYNIPFLGLA